MLIRGLLGATNDGWSAGNIVSICSPFGIAS